MSSKTIQPKRFNALKWTVVFLLLAGAVVGNIYFDSYDLSIRASALIVVGLVAIGIAVTTTKGTLAWGFLKDARMEMRKVVWPTRQETLQTTMMVIAIVAVMCLILWGIDSLFALMVSQVII